MIFMFRRYAIILLTLLVPVLLSYMLFPLLVRTPSPSQESPAAAIHLAPMARTPVYFLSHGGPNIVSLSANGSR